MQRVVALALGVLAAACHTKRPLELPEAPVNAQSMLVAVDTPAGGLIITAFDWPGGRPGALGLERDSKITILYYEDTLQTLGLEPGIVPDGTGKAFVAPLPNPDDGFESALDGDGYIRDWEVIAGLVGKLADFRIEGVSPQVCARGGGCYPSDDARTRNACVLPCPYATAVLPPTAPDPVVPPEFERPMGWRDVVVDGITVYEPPTRTCTGHQLIDQTACDGVGSACPADGWPAVLPTDRTVLYVDAAATAGGSGTLASPYDSLADALAAAPAVVAIALRRGSYAPGLQNLVGDLQIIGACASDTTIDLGLARFDVSGASTVELEDLTIRRGIPALAVTNGGTVTTRGVVLDGTGAAAQPRISAEAATIHMEDMVIVESSSTAVALVGGTATFDHVLVRDGVGIAFDLHGDAVVDIVDTVVERGGNSAVRVGSDAEVTITRALFDDNAHNTLRIEGGTATLDYVVVTNGHAFNGADGRALHALRGAMVTLEHGWFKATETSGIRLDGSQLVVSDTVIRDASPQPQGMDHGMGIALLSGSSMTATRLDVADTFRRGINVLGASHLTGSDIKIARVKLGVRTRFATGLEVGEASTLSVTRVHVIDVATVAVEIDSESACKSDERTGKLEIFDLSVLNGATLGHSLGIRIQCSANIEFKKTSVVGSDSNGILVTGSAIARFDDLHVEGAPRRALDVFSDGRFIGERVRLLNSSNLMSADFRGVIEMRHGTLACAPADQRLGIAVRHKNFGVYDLKDFDISACEVALWLRYAEAVDVANGTIHGNQIAVETADGELEPFMLNVAYDDNDVLVGEYVNMRNP